jgi:hypothetical protein
VLHLLLYLLLLHRPSEASEAHPPAPNCPYTQLKQYYWLDLAAVLPALLLDVQPGHVVLDMCAAPGAKALVLAMQLLLGQTNTEPDDAAADGEGPRSSLAAQQQGSLTPELLQQLSLNGQQQPAAGSTSSSLQQQEAQQPAVQLSQQPPSGANKPEEAQQHTAVAGEAASATAAQQATGGEQGLAVEKGNEEGQEEDAGEEEEEDWPPAAASSSSSVGRLVLNDVDPSRRSRLSAVLSSHIPGSLRRHVRLTGHDAAKHWSRWVWMRAR